MSFTQEKGLNIGENFKNQKIVFPHITPVQKTTKCDGCDKKCEIGTVIVCDTIYPTICGERVLYYKSEAGVQYPLTGLYAREFKSHTIARMRTLELGQELTRLCDHYKMRPLQDTIKENKMSFTQENKTNICICDGCEQRCKLGYYEETEQEAKDKTTNARRIASTLPVKRFVWPTIDGKKIISFFDKYGEPQQCVFESEFLHLPHTYKVREYKQKILEKAYEIAKLCDHYKTR